MASSLVFPLAGLTDLGGQAFKGLLEGEELERRERERQQKMQHQGFLERLESERLRMQDAHNRATEQRLNQYLQRGQHLSLGGGRVMQVLPDGSTRIIDAGAAPETPAQKASRELTEAQTVEARRRTEQLGQPKEPGDPIKHSQSLYAQQLRSQGVPEDEIIRRLSGLTPKTTPARLPALTHEYVQAIASGGVQDERLSQRAAKAMLEADEQSKIRVAREGAGIREGVQERKEERKVERGLGTMETAIGQMESVLGALDTKGFLPKPTPANNMFAAIKEQARAIAHQKAYWNDPDWQKWITNQGALIGIDRSVYNDLGRGGQAMFSAVKGFSEHPPTAEAARGVFQQFRGGIAANRAAGRGQQGTRVRDPKTGRMGTVPPGEPIPPGLEVMR